MGSEKESWAYPTCLCQQEALAAQRLPVGALLLPRSLQSTQLPFHHLLSSLQLCLSPHSWPHSSDPGLSPWQQFRNFHSQVSLWLTRQDILPRHSQYRRMFYHHPLCYCGESSRHCWSLKQVRIHVVGAQKRSWFILLYPDVRRAIIPHSTQRGLWTGTELFPRDQERVVIMIHFINLKEALLYSN